MDISGDNNIAQNFNSNFANGGRTDGEKSSDSFAFSDYISNANVGEPFKFPTVSFESLETIFGSLKKSVALPWWNPYFLKKSFHLLGPVLLQICDEISKRGSANIVEKKYSLF